MGAFRPSVNPGEVVDQLHGSPQIEEITDKSGGNQFDSIPNLTDNEHLDPISTATGTTPTNNNTSNGLYPFPISDVPSLGDESNTGDHIPHTPLVTSPQPSISIKSDARHINPYANGISGSNYMISRYNAPASLPYYDSPQLPSGTTNSNVKSLQFKKPKPKKLQNQMSGPPKRPAFVMKLWNMVNDPSNSKYISWLPDGKAFQVSDRESFMRHVLPKYFKHNNFASFVRQLNMYGWHKIQDVNSGSLVQGDEVWQFENPNFIKGKENLLDNIVRNRSSKEEDDDIDINTLLMELESMKQKQRIIADDLSRLVQDNELLWKENYMARERQKAQSETLDKILRFLVTLYGGSSKFLESAGGAPNEFLEMASKRDAQEQQHNPHGPDFDMQQQMHHQQPSSYYQPQKGNSRLMLTHRAHNNGSKSTSRDTSSSQSIYNGSDASDSPIQEIRRGPENQNNEQLDGYKPYPLHGTPQFQHPLPNFQSPVSMANSPRSYFPEISTQVPHSSVPATPSALSSASPLQQDTDANMPPEYLMGNINQQLDKQQSSIRQINDWISRLASSKLPDEINANQQPLMDDFRMDDFLLPQTPNGGVDPSLTTDDNYGEIYNPSRQESNESHTDSASSRASTFSGKKRRESSPSSEDKKRIRQT